MWRSAELLSPSPDDIAPARIDPIRAGLLCRCPQCGVGPLFQGFLKVRPTCEACGYGLAAIETGDGAATFIMQIAGFLVGFSALFVEIVYHPPIWLHLVVWLPLVIVLALGLMRPGKGLMTALQYRSRTEGTRAS